MAPKDVMPPKEPNQIQGERFVDSQLIQLANDQQPTLKICGCFIYNRPLVAPRPNALHKE